MNTLRVIITTAACMIICCGNAFSQSNQGKEFWTGYMSHQEDNGMSQMSLYITADHSTTGKVEITDGSFAAIPFTVTANQVTIVAIPRTAFLKTQGQFLKGLHITAQKSIAVYAHIFAQSVSGATLLLPVTTLGKDYYSINYTQQSNANPSYSTFMVIATEDNTVVEVTPSQTLADGKEAGVPFTLSLKKGELYQGLALADLTNTRIRTVSTTGECKKVAVFSGSTKIGIGCRQAGFTSDNLFQQVYPTASWGKNYITVPLKSRNYDVYRVVFSQPNTQLQINGQTISANNAANSFYEFSSQKTNVITADKPIQVVQYAVTQGQTLNECVNNRSDIGDPEMIYLTPIEQTLDHVTLFSAPYYNIAYNYINVVIKKDMVPTFLLDGEPYIAFTDVADNPLYAYAQIQVSSGTHNIGAAGGFNAIAYGFGSAESYGYAAGANFKNLNEYIALANKNGSALVQVNGCTGVEYKLQLTLPYQTSTIKWNLNDGSTPYVDTEPVVASTVQKDGVTLYNYIYYKPVKFTPGDYSITATVDDPLADVCGSTTDVDFDFNIVDYPDAGFSMAGACEGDTAVFTDKSNPKGSNIKTWQWDFGDRQTSALQNPKHIYSAAGDYNVVLSVVNENGCSSTTQPIKVHIFKNPAPLFKNSLPACLGSEITFTDQSAPGEGDMIKWVWDFGDGTPQETYTDNKPVKHQFKNTGNYTVKLTVTNVNGCTALYSKDYLINTAPKVDFDLPDICLDDAFAQFTDKSSIAGNNTSGFAYLWDFGDTNAANPNTSTEKNPKHKYSRADNYTVTLTVTSAGGCPATVQKVFTVNGSVAEARFAVDNSSNLCSTGPVIFNDQSVASFGKITRLVWYYDYANNPQQSEVIDKADLAADHKYNHTYPLFNFPASKTYTVKMEAYSGQACMKEYIQQIVIQANPLVKLVQLSPVCRESAPVQLLVDKNGFTGSGIFSGNGVSAGGMFSPKTAGAGIAKITYKFTAQNGCDYTASEDIVVNQNPTVNTGDDIILLEGNSVVLKPLASGTGLTYKWYPSAGLDYDDVLNPVTSAVDDINYQLIVTNADGCTAADDIFVSVLKKPIASNTFTPNNDGINDTWNIRYLENYPGNTVDIFDRYGTKIYSSLGYPVPWDGRYRGNDLPMGTYYYIINPKNGRKVISGNVTIIR